MQKSTARSGNAVVVLRDGREYEGHLDVIDGIAHFDGKRRVRDDAAKGQITYRPVGSRSWPFARIAEVRWLVPNRSAR